MWNSWITQLVANYSIDGLRVDSAREVNTAFFPPFESAAGVYIVGEIYVGDPSIACPFQNYMDGFLNYPMYFLVLNAFDSTSGSISNLVNGINEMKSDCLDTTLLGSFIENQDIPRFPSYTSDNSLDMNAIAYNILADGIPIIYEGQEQHFSGGNLPANREAVWTSGYSQTSFFYLYIKSLNTLRSWVISKDSTWVTYKAVVGYSDTSTIVMRKGNAGTQTVSVLSNLGASGSSYNLTLSSSATGFTAGQALTEVLSCTAYKTDSSGNLAVAMASGYPRIFYPTAQLTGFTCTPSTTGTGTTPPSSGTVPITFISSHATSYGDTIKLTGSITALSDWSTSSAITLSASNYTTGNPIWYATVNLVPGTAVQWKFFNLEASGTILWESGANQAFTVPNSSSQIELAW